VRHVQRTWAAAALVFVASLLAPSTGFGQTASETFSTVGEHAFSVPGGVTSVDAELVGGNGGAGDYGAPGGIPATASATIGVTPGETLYAEVAGDGHPASGAGDGLGGSGEGGDGGTVFAFITSNASGGGGGGASDVRTCAVAAAACQTLSSRLLVAGGGGGGGGAGTDGVTAIAGGAGGAADQAGLAGASDGSNDGVGAAGGRGTGSAGGSAGTNATAGGLGSGGAGGFSALVAGAGGGGGGGIFGGGGGGAAGEEPLGSGVIGSGGGGGGVGSSGVPAGAAGVSGFTLTPTAQGAEPQVTFTWTLPAPTVGGGTGPSGPSGGTGPAGPGGGLGAAVISNLNQTHRTWRELRHPRIAQITQRRAPIDTTFRFTLDKPATIRLAFIQLLPGRKAASGCVVPTASNRAKGKCTRILLRGTMSFGGHAGTNKVHFDGSVSRTRVLRPGNYTLVATATSPGVGSTCGTLTFSIVT
jgi:hypothetical protein